ncbi:hypothetical protein BU25DRAFT_412233 [Macroventuria anomochaeta]|uniref:Uncharacterized protein n=1 Tax=Macroventuria anomochaeta TaxID=301207 RepID=A0ACB6RX48_9PLEO|nr:uncharacterized protein BU25DRAFT_412233 [Macroventuria anomochaeta]KAF2625990.1 hypothetical protein BU25DRAFT_412233 [Macroventuria anomochaeta]
MRQCCPGNILDGIRTYSISLRDLFVGDLLRTWQDFSVSCNYYGLGFLATVLVSGSLSHAVSQLSGRYGGRPSLLSIVIFVSTTPNTWTLSTALLDIPRMITSSTALLCINSALSLSLLRVFLQHFLRAFSPLRTWSTSLWGGQDYKGTNTSKLQT